MNYGFLIETKTIQRWYFKLSQIVTMHGQQSSASRARPYTKNGTVYTDTGNLMRGATMDIRKQTNPPCNQQAVWDYYRSKGLNLVRLGVKTDHDGVGRSIASQIPYIDAAVECAAKARMYVMILVSITPGSYNLDQLTSFWTAIASRYKDREHVMYEITNEPTSGGGYWGATAHWTIPKLTDLRGVHDIMRSGAPNTMMAMFCTCNLAPNAPSWRTVPQNFETLGSPIDWSKTLISFHHYPGTYNFGDPNGFGGIALMKSYGYNMLMSECNDFIGDGPSSDPRNKEQIWLWLEQYDVSWINLDGKSGTISTQIEPEILPYLAANGYPLTFE